MGSDLGDTKSEGGERGSGEHVESRTICACNQLQADTVSIELVGLYIYT